MGPMSAMQTPIRQKQPNFIMSYFRPSKCRLRHSVARGACPLRPFPQPLFPRLHQAEACTGNDLEQSYISDTTVYSPHKRMRPVLYWNILSYVDDRPITYEHTRPMKHQQRLSERQQLFGPVFSSLNVWCELNTALMFSSSQRLGSFRRHLRRQDF